jgi:cytosine/adenosine deaminase-related metal-dependent hydrolase
MKKSFQQVSGYALLGDELALSPVDIFIKNGVITAIEDNPRVPKIWICPALFNAHTHLGDMIAMDCGTTGDLEALVTPPEGLKHQLLRAASRQDLVSGMRAGMEGMIATGTAGCADFREGGIEGVLAIQDAAAGLSFFPFVFGREGGETVAGGLGISSVRDVPDAERLVAEAKRTGKKIAFHAGERDADDVDAALAYEPDLLIHMTHATKKQLRECAEKEIPIAVCPRSNWILGVASSSWKSLAVRSVSVRTMRCLLRRTCLLKWHLFRRSIRSDRQLYSGRQSGAHRSSTCHFLFRKGVAQICLSWTRHDLPCASRAIRSQRW